MTDLSNLATEHGLDARLYHGSVIDKILSLIRDHRYNRFVSETIDVDLSAQGKWDKIISLLRK